jgi:hypothetical protein|tara:strand:- start:174 stop:413 length:240 start_codon:yes stop_codon:yes gene_type:complete
MKLIGIDVANCQQLRISALTDGLLWFIRDNPEYYKPGYSAVKFRKFATEWAHGQRSTNLPDWAYPVLESVDYTAPKDWR